MVCMSLAVTVPTFAATIVNGDLIKSAGSSALYLVSGSNKRVIPHATVYHSWGYPSNYSTVKTVTAAELASYADGTAVPFRDGSLFRGVTSSLHGKSASAVFVVSDGKLRPIKSATVYQALYKDPKWKLVKWIPDNMLSKFNYPIGDMVSDSTIHPNGTVVKYATSSTLYLIEGGKKRAFTSWSAYTANRYQNANVVTIPDTETYADGANITGAESALVTPGAGPVVGVGDLTVSLAADNPAAAVIASSTAYNSVLKVNLTASSAGPVSVKGIKVTKSGLAANTVVSGILLIDQNGVRHGNVISSLAADNTATISFASDPIVVAAGTTVPVTIQFNNSATGTNGTIQFSIASASDVIVDAGNVTGVFPITGNIMSLQDGTSTIGAFKVDAVVLHNNGAADTTAVNVNMDTVDQEIGKFRFTETSSKEDIVLTKITVYNNGSATDSDFKNVDLVDQGGTVLATADASDRKVVFDISYTIPKGTFKDLTVRADIVSGSGRTIRFLIQNDYDVVAKGASSKAGILGTAASLVDNAFPIGDYNNASAYYINKVTVSSGSLTFSRAVDSPTTNIVAGKQNEVLAKYDVKANGENMELRTMTIQIVKGGATNLTGTVYIKVDGSTVYSIAASTTGIYNTGTAYVANLTSYPTLTAGQTSSITVEVSVDNAATAADSYRAKIDITQVKRLVTGDLIDPGVNPADGLPRSIKTAALSVTTSSTPVASNVVRGQQDFVFANFIFDASAGGEDVKISSIKVTDTLGGNAAYADLANLELFDGATKLSTTNNTATNANTVTFILTTPLIITKSMVKTLTLKADVVGDADGTGNGKHTYKVNAAADITAIGKDTGNTVTPVVAGAGQAMTIKTKGTLAVTASVSPSENKNIEIATTGNSFTNFELRAYDEDVSIDTILVTAQGTSIANTDYKNIGLYNGATLIASTPQFAVANTFTYNVSGLLTVTRGTPIILTVKADIGAAGTAKLNNDIRFNIVGAADIVGKGVYSGEAITAGSATTAYTNTIVPALVTTAKSGSSPSGEITVIAGSTLAVFDVKNNGSKTITLTDFKVTDTGAHTGVTTSYDLVDYNTNTVYKANVLPAGGVIDFNTLAINFNGSETKSLAVKVNTLGAAVAGDTFRMTIANINDVKFSATEANLGYDGNIDGDMVDTIIAMPGNSKAYAEKITKK